MRSKVMSNDRQPCSGHPRFRACRDFARCRMSFMAQVSALWRDYIVPRPWALGSSSKAPELSYQDLYIFLRSTNTGIEGTGTSSDISNMYKVTTGNCVLHHSSSAGWFGGTFLRVAVLRLSSTIAPVIHVPEARKVMQEAANECYVRATGASMFQIGKLLTLGIWL